MKVIECPVCGTDKNSSGEDLGNLRSLSLHIAGKAISGKDFKHRNWVKELLPDTNVGSYTVPGIDSHIRGHVWNALKEQEPEEFFPEDRDVVEGEGEKEPYIRAYAHLWEIETRLHRFVSVRLESEYGHHWWQAFPNKLKHECIDKADADKYYTLSPDCYIDFLDLREVIKHDKNREFFKPVFESLNSDYKDPQSEFHQKLERVNRIRNNIMHPLKRLAPSHEDMDTLEQFLEFVRKFTMADIS